MADTIGELLVRLGFDPSGLDSGATAVEKRLEQTGTRLFFMGSRIAAGFSAPLGVAVGIIAKFGMAFDQAMTESLAIMDRVTPEIRSKMEAQARAVSESTKFTAEEGAKAYYSLASAGMSAAQSTEALPVVARFAQAGVMDLAKASESLVAVQTGLGLKTSDVTQNMINMTRVSDVLVGVNNMALGTVKDYTAGLERSAGSLRLYNKDVTEGAAVLSAYADKGIMGATAGQQLYMVLRDLSNAAVKQPEHFKQAGIAVFDTSGKMRNMADIMDDMTKRFAPLSDAGKRTEIAFLGLTSRSQNALLPLLGMGDRIRQVQTALEGVSGVTEEVAGKQMESLKNQVHVVTSKFTNLGIELFGAFIPVIRSSVIPLAEQFVAKAKEWAKYLETMDDTGKKWVMGLIAAGVALGPVVMFMGSLMLTARAVISPVTEMIGLIARFIPTAAVAGETAAAVGTGFSWLNWATKAVALFTEPWLWIPAAIGAVALVLRELTGSWEGVWNLMKLFMPPLVLLPDLFSYVASAGRGLWSLLGDLGAILNGVVKLGFDYLKDAFQWMASVGASVSKQGVKDFLLYATGIGETRDVFLAFRNTMEDWFPVAKQAREWVTTKLGDGFTYMRDKIHEAAEAFRSFDKMLDLATVNAPKANIFANPGAVSLPGGMSIDEYLDQANRDKASAGAADTPETTRTKNILDRISGKSAFEDADAWAKAIKAVGGVGKLATDDVDTALKVFETATDRAIKLEGANSKLAESYGKVWSALLTQDPSSMFIPMKPASEGLFTGGLSNNVDMSWQKDAQDSYRLMYGTNGKGDFGNPKNLQGLGGYTPGLIGGKGEDPGKWLKDLSKSIGTMSTASSDLNRIGKAIGGGTGDSLQSIGTILGIGAGSGKAGVAMHSNFDLFTQGHDGEEPTTKDKMSGALGMGVAAIEAYGMWSAATNNKSMGANVAGGAMSGASAGMAIGGPIGAGVGAAVGAVAALIKGKPEWAKIQADIGRDMGVTISDELAKALESDSKKFGRAATTNIHLSDIIGDAGGLNTGNLEMFTGKLHDTFALLGQDTLTVAQSTKILDDNFGTFVAAGTDGYGRLSSDLKEIINLNDVYGTNSKAIGDYLKGQGSAAMAGFTAVAAGILQPYSELSAKIEEAKNSGEGLNELLDEQTKLSGGAKGELDALGIQAVASFSAAVAAGVPWSEALRAIAPSVSKISQTYAELGLSVDNVAFSAIAMQAQIVDKNPVLMDAISGLSGQMVALDNMNLMNADSFKAMQDTGYTLYQRLNTEVTKLGGTAMDSLLPMQEYLHQAYDQSILLGIPLGANTQGLIDQSKELGIWGEKGKSANDIMMLGFAAIIEAVGGEIPDAFKKFLKVQKEQVVPESKVHAQHVQDAYNDIRINPVHVPVWYDSQNEPSNNSGVPDYPEMAEGGILTGPRIVRAGEAGNEAIIPLNRLEKMINMGGGGGDAVIILQVDGREMARTTVEHMPGILRQHGLFT